VIAVGASFRVSDSISVPAMSRGPRIRGDEKRNRPVGAALGDGNYRPRFRIFLLRLHRIIRVAHSRICHPAPVANPRRWAGGTRSEARRSLSR
jgi:hypothetical protein